MFRKALLSHCFQFLNRTIFSIERESSHMVQLMQFTLRLRLRHCFPNILFCEPCKRAVAMHNWENWFSLLFFVEFNENVQIPSEQNDIIEIHSFLTFPFDFNVRRFILFELIWWETWEYVKSSKYEKVRRLICRLHSKATYLLNINSILMAKFQLPLITYIMSSILPTKPLEECWYRLWVSSITRLSLRTHLFLSELPCFQLQLQPWTFGIAYNKTYKKTECALQIALDWKFEVVGHLITLENVTVIKILCNALHVRRHFKRSIGEEKTRELRIK